MRIGNLKQNTTAWRVLAVALAILMPALALAATTNRFWTGGGATGDFEDPANWTGGIVPANNLTNDVAVFSNAPTANQPTLTLPTRDIYGVRFESSGWSLGGGTNQIRAGVNGGTAAIATPTSGTNTINTYLSIGRGGDGGHTYMTVATGGTVRVSGKFDTFIQSGNGGGDVYVSGGGTLLLDDTNNIYVQVKLYVINATVRDLNGWGGMGATNLTAGYLTLKTNSLYDFDGHSLGLTALTLDQGAELGNTASNNVLFTYRVQGGSATYALNGLISGPLSFEMENQNGGVYYLLMNNASNTYTGTTRMDPVWTCVVGADVPAGAPSPLGNSTSAVQLGSGLLASNPCTVGRDIVLLGATPGPAMLGSYTTNLAGTIAYSGTTWVGASATANLGVTNPAGAQVDFTGDIRQMPGGTGTGTVTKLGAGVVRFLGPNTSVGGLFVTGGAAIVANGAVFEANILSNAPGGGLVITNAGGTYRFTTNAPTIIPNGSLIAINGGTLSYHNIPNGALPDLTNNWGTTGVGALQWRGNNTFRLDNACAVQSLGRPYVFDTGRGATNFVRLEMVNGSTLYGGVGITIGAGGSASLANAFLEASALTNAGAAFTNVGSGSASGGFQFTTPAPSLTVGSGIALQNGVLSYRGITDADVRANQNGWPGANATVAIGLLGSNGFELNASTNTATTDQAYTFSAGLGVTNFAGLAMVNGVTRYRNGSVTIAADGWLLISNTVATFDGAVTNLGQALTVNSTVTYAGPYVIASGAGNAIVNSAVNYNGGYSTLGGVTNWIVNGTLGGANYVVGASDLLGFGATNVWGVDTNANAGFQVLANGTLWVSNNAFVVFTVPLTNAGAVLISSNAVLQANRIVNDPATGSIVNNAGLFEFTTSAPFVSTGVGGIVLTNGGISYRGVTNVDVKANWAGYASANDTVNIGYGGWSFFRLNNATNRADVDQTYAFDTGLGATNFAGLVLMGGSVYRSGIASIGPGGWLLVTNAATITQAGLTNQGAVWVATGSSLNGNTLASRTLSILGAGATWNQGSNTFIVGNVAGYGTNALTVDAGVFTNVAVLTLGSVAGAAGNRATVANGGQMYSIGGTLGNAGAANSNTVTVTGAGSLWSLGGGALALASTGGSTGNVLTVAGGGVVTNAGLISVGNNAASAANGVVVSNGSAIASLGLSLGANGSQSNSVILRAGSTWSLGNGALTWGSGAGANGNSLEIDGTSCLTNVTGLVLGDNYTTFAMTNAPAGFVLNGLTTAQLSFNPGFGALTVGPGGSVGTALVLDNYTLATSSGILGASATARSNAVTVGAASTWSNTTTIVFSGANNALVVTNGGRVSCVNATLANTAAAGFNTIAVSGGGSTWSLGNSLLTIASAANTGNVLRVDGGGVVTNITTLKVGTAAGANTNTVQLTGGGLLEVSLGITMGATGNSGNAVTNQGGILQFTTAAPGITNNAGNGGNAIMMTNATLGYRGMQSGTLPDLTNNWGTVGVGLFTWQGATNAFRLDNALATNSLGRPYIFSASLGPTNYARLELINGTTAVLGSGSVLGIASDGALLLSNTAATIYGPFTNNGTMTIVNSTLTFATNAVLNGTVAIDLDHRSTTNGMVTANALSLGGTLALTGSLTNMNLFTYTSLNGQFGSISGLPANYGIMYGTGTNGVVSLQRLPRNGSIIIFR